MTIVSFIVTAGFYFLLAPVAIAILIRRCQNHVTFRLVWITILSIAVLSWGVASVLAGAVFVLSPDLLPQPVLLMSFRCGWAFAFVTSFPALVLYAIPRLAIRSGRVRDVISFTLLSVPFVLLCLWYVPLIEKLGIGD